MKPLPYWKSRYIDIQLAMSHRPSASQMKELQNCLKFAGYKLKSLEKKIGVRK
jgi:hypothetical protein